MSTSKSPHCRSLSPLPKESFFKSFQPSFLLSDADFDSNAPLLTKIPWTPEKADLLAPIPQSPLILDVMTFFPLPPCSPSICRAPFYFSSPLSDTGLGFLSWFPTSVLCANTVTRDRIPPFSTSRPALTLFLRMEERPPWRILKSLRRPVPPGD